jgi:GTPase KRas protein
MEIIDTAGQEEYTSLSDHFIREGDGFLLVYNIYDWISFTGIAKYQYQIIKIKGRDCNELPIMLVAHDFSDGIKAPYRQVSSEEGRNLAKSIGCKFVEASAETGDGVEDAFYGIVRTIRTQQSEWDMAYRKTLSKIPE